MPCDSAAGFRHLHKGNYPLLHARPTACGKKYHRKLLLCCVLKKSGNFFAHYAAHAGHHKVAVHYSDTAAIAMYVAFSCNSRIFCFALLLHFSYFLFVIGEVNGIFAGHTTVKFYKAVRVGGHIQSVLPFQACVIITSGADPSVFLKVLHIRHRAAAGTFKEQILRYANVFASILGSARRFLAKTRFYDFKKILKQFL